MSPNVVHPDLRFVARFLPSGVARKWLLPVLRWLKPPAGAMPRGLVVREMALPGTTATVRIVGPVDDERGRPVLLWMHGGGYIIGSAVQDDALCARYAQRLGVTVVSVDYRLAPEHPWPAPLDDCVAAYDFVQREAAALGLDPRRVIVAGQSAGGGLAAALVLRLHDSGRPAPIFQLLVYPMLDDRTAARTVEGLTLRVWDQESNVLGWSSYLARAPGGDGVTDHMAPARREDLRGLPPAWIGVGTLDLFHDEDLAYARRLVEAGVPASLEVVDGAFHGFDAVMPKAPVSRAFFDAQVAAVAGVLSGAAR